MQNAESFDFVSSLFITIKKAFLAPVFHFNYTKSGARGLLNCFKLHSGHIYMTHYSNITLAGMNRDTAASGQ